MAARLPKTARRLTTAELIELWSDSMQNPKPQSPERKPRRAGKVTAAILGLTLLGSGVAVGCSTPAEAGTLGKIAASPTYNVGYIYCYRWENGTKHSTGGYFNGGYVIWLRQQGFTCTGP